MSALQKIADVLIVLPVLDPSGAERVVAELAKRLPALGFPVSVLCLEDETAPIGIELKNAGISVSGLRLSRRASFRCGEAIARHIRGMQLNRPLIVCSQLFHANIAARLAAKKLSASERKSVYFLSAIQVAERRFRPWQFWFDRVTAKYACYEICVAKSVASFQRKRTNLPATFFKVVENGNDLAPYAALPALRERRESDALRVVSVGRLNKQKDYPTLLRAWERVEQSLPRARLEIAGSGPEESRLKALAAKLKLQRVAFAGFCSDVPGFLDGADLYVQSSAWEGLPLSVFEAMAAGRPVIASAVDSVPDMIENGRTGILFERGNDAELASRMVDLANDFPRAQALGFAAREMALKRFSADRMAAEYAALFEQVLSELKA